MLLGAAAVVATFLSAITMVVVPRGVPVRLTRLVFLVMRRLFSLRTRFARTYEARDSALALYAPLTLIVIPVVWLTIVLLGYTAMFWALGAHPWRSAFTTSGSSLLTLGFAVAHDLPSTVLAFTEAVFGLILLALLITYLPSMYAAFSKRETQVAMLATFAGQPPSGVDMIVRFWRLSDFDHLDDAVWEPWTSWFTELEETHTSLSSLPFFRSPRPDRSWVTASGAVLDGAALMSSVVDYDRSPPAELCIRSGYTSLRTIADFFSIPYEADPRPDDPICVTRDEFDDACRRLEDAGVPLRADREQAWRDFAGWRVNYDTVLVSLAGFLLVPYAPWSSDRSARAAHRPSLRRSRR